MAVAYAKHIIKKQVIELEIEEGLNTTDIQNRVSRIYRDAVVPLLDKLFSDKSAASSLVIDHLEIDIGSIPEHKLEAMLTEKIKTALQENLAAIKSSPAANFQVEVKHGIKQQDKHSDEAAMPAEKIKTALQENPAAIKFSPAVNFPVEIRHDIKQQDKHSDEALIIYFLQTGLFPWWAQENNYSFLEQYLHTVIKQNNTAFKNSFINLLQDDEIIKRLVYTFNDALHETITKHFFNISLVIIQPETEELFSVFTDWYDLKNLQAYWRLGLYKAIIASTIHSEKKLFERTAELFISSALQAENIATALLSPSTNNEQIKFSEKINGLNNKFLAEALKNHLQNKINDEASGHKQRTMPVADLNQKPHTIPAVDLDKIYIQHAGLILLHPFLPRFFQNLGLADDKYFNDESAAERACLILQYLATGNTDDIFEAQLPLNKILCGIPLLQLVATQFAITENEKEIAEHFLLSVMQNGGGGWKNLSVEGLRKAYLSREGIISARDGNWLLQVKRETYDILIDRLPWTIQIVKLPWMKLLVFVEWQVV